MRRDIAETEQSRIQIAAGYALEGGVVTKRIVAAFSNPGKGNERIVKQYAVISGGVGPLREVLSPP
jgi:hypothetical protein